MKYLHIFLYSTCEYIDNFLSKIKATLVHTKKLRICVQTQHLKMGQNLWMRYSRVVRASDIQFRSRNCPGFDPSILWHSGIWGVADEAVLNIVHKKKSIQKILLKIQQKPIGIAWLHMWTCWIGKQIKYEHRKLHCSLSLLLTKFGILWLNSYVACGAYSTVQNGIAMVNAPD